MCSVSAFIQVHTDWQKYWQVHQCSLIELYTNSKIYSYSEYVSNGLAVSAPLRLLVAYRFTHMVWLNRSVPTDPVLGLHSRSGQCWACISTLPLKLNLRFFVSSNWYTAPASPGLTPPSSRSKTCSVSFDETNVIGNVCVRGSISMYPKNNTKIRQE